ncbi:hypothetical protein JCM8097_003500 [Rhodosporidiobolus ruineniae]
MRLQLNPTAACASQLSSLASSSSTSDPPLLFIDKEPFLVEMQGQLELPPGEQEEAAKENEGRSEMEGVRVGKVDLSDPKKPVLRIAHHRLEGKLETLLTPYALLRTIRNTSSSSSSTNPSSDHPSAASSASKRSAPDTADDPAPKRPRPDSSSASSSSDSPSSSTQISIAAIIRRKIVFSRRPEPLIEVSSEADPAFSKERARTNKPHPLAGLGGAGGAAAAAAGAAVGAKGGKGKK